MFAVFVKHTWRFSKLVTILGAFTGNDWTDTLYMNSGQKKTDKSFENY